MDIQKQNERRRLLFIMNPKAGTMQTAKYLMEILNLYSASGYLTSVLMTQKAGDARAYAEAYAKEVDLIVCAGGDGTLNEVIAGILSAGADTCLGYIPAGSTNDFANSIGLPKGVMDAAERVLTGTPHTFDIGSFNGRNFSYVASFGAFTSTSYRVPQNLKNIMGHNAYILQGMRDVFDIKPIHVRLIADEDTPNEYTYEGDCIFGAVMNSMQVGGVLRLDTFDIDMNDGLMEILLIETPSNLIELNNIVRALLEQTLDSPEIRFFSAKRIRIEIEQNTHWTLDGEYEKGTGSILIDTLRSAVRLIV